MDAYLLRKLERFEQLDQPSFDLFYQLASRPARRIAARETIFEQGESPQSIYLVAEGWVCRYSQLPGGRRQITGIFLPGDFCDLNLFLLHRVEHTLASISPVLLVEIPRSAFEPFIASHAAIAQTIWRDALRAASIQRQWLINMGQRNTLPRLAHLFCELFARLRHIGLATDGSCAMPLNQYELAAALGVSAVHINRTLQDLRAARLIQLRSKILTILDFRALAKMAAFDDGYLHLQVARNEVVAGLGDELRPQAAEGLLP